MPELVAVLELREPPAQRLERKIALFQFELLFVEQLDQEQVLLIDQVAALLGMLQPRSIEHVLQLGDLALEDVLPFSGDTEQITQALELERE